MVPLCGILAYKQDTGHSLPDKKPEELGQSQFPLVGYINQWRIVSFIRRLRSNTQLLLWRLKKQSLAVIQHVTYSMEGDCPIQSSEHRES